MKDESRVIANSLVAYASRGVAAVVGIALVPYLLGHLGEERYGVIGILNAILGFVALIDLGIRTAISRQFTRFMFGGETERSNELASTAFALYGLMAVVVLATIGLLGDAFLEAMKVPAALLSEAMAALVIISLSFVITLVATPYGSALVSKLRYDIRHYTEMLGTVLRALIIVLAFSLYQSRLYIWALAYLIAALTAFSIQRWQAHRCCPSLRIRRRLITRRGLQDVAGFGFYTSAVRLANWLDLRSGPIIVSYFLGTAAVAHFTPAMVLVLSLEPLTEAFIIQLLPIVTKAHVRADLSAIRSVLVRSTRYTLIMGGGAMTWLASTAFPLISIWLGATFRDTAFVLLARCATAMLQACVGGSVSIFIGTGRLRPIAAFNAVLSTMSIAISIYLVGWTSLGVIGAALGMLGAQVLRTCFYLILATRICQVDGGELVRKAFIGPLLCLAALGASSLTMQRILTLGPWFEFVIASGVSLLIFAALGWCLGLNTEDRTKVRDYVSKGWKLALDAIGRRASGGTP